VGGKRVKGPQAAHLDQAQASTTAANIFTQLVTSQHNSSPNSINSILSNFIEHFTSPIKRMFGTLFLKN